MTVGEGRSEMTVGEGRSGMTVGEVGNNALAKAPNAV